MKLNKEDNIDLKESSFDFKSQKNKKKLITKSAVYITVFVFVLFFCFFFVFFVFVFFFFFFQA